MHSRRIKRELFAFFSLALMQRRLAATGTQIESDTYLENKWGNEDENNSQFLTDIR